MPRFPGFRSYKSALEISFLGLAGLAIAVTGWVASDTATEALRSSAFERLTGMHRVRARQIEYFFDDLRSHVSALANDETTLTALEDFAAAWPPGPAWNRAHDLHNSSFQRYQQAFGAYDLFLITPAGRVVYTVRDESDMGASLTAQNFQDTALAKAHFRALTLSRRDPAVFEDYTAYQPSWNAPAAFFATPVWKGDRKIGVLALQVSVDEVNRVISGDGRWQSDGFGETGQAYMVDAANQLRSDLRKREGDGTHILEPHGGQPVSGAGTAVSADNTKLRAWGPLAVRDVQWTLVAEIDTAEAFAPIRTLHWRIFGFGLGIALVFFLAAHLLAGNVTAPLSALAENARRLGSRDFSARLQINREDELGALADSFNRMAADLEKTTVSKQAIDRILSSMLNAVFVAVDGVITVANPAAESLLGYAPGALAGRPVPVAATPAGRVPVETELTRLDGQKVPVLLAAAPLSPEGGIVYAAQDITELRRLAGRLIAAQEEERSRVARELHDDFSQRLAVAALNAARRGDEDARRELAGIATDLHTLSRHLHPAMIDDLGLETAVAAECRASFERGGPPVDFSADGDVDDLPPDAALALFRIVQEALRNIGRHASANQVTVRLRAVPGAVTLEIDDDGVGFNANDESRRSGLGLAAMDERARLLGGRFELRAVPGQGVHIHVEIPREARS